MLLEVPEDVHEERHGADEAQGRVHRRPHGHREGANQEDVGGAEGDGEPGGQGDAEEESRLEGDARGGNHHVNA